MPRAIDAYSAGAPGPADSPYLTSVGGTLLSTDGGGWASESVWNDGGGQGASGGISSSYSLPYWQTGIDMTANQGSVRQRNIPDVAMMPAKNVFVVLNNGQQFPDVGGTSCAAPLWAGFTALVNQQAAPTASRRSALSTRRFTPSAAAPATRPVSRHHHGQQHQSSPTNFFAVPGYDLCTGWGTPNGSNLISALLSPVSPPAIQAAGWRVLAGGCEPTNATINPGDWVMVGFVLESKTEPEPVDQGYPSRIADGSMDASSALL